ncbi:LLM class flavin-dependent oxidoreductase [Nocardia araoensis]|uniref:LLM class flavin-dependent oxidoreductase n=1 Tax=Nocardia araoensis TaxID=228600 RepID=UPI0005844937|nr:LLM class flavin-dependent oxidoreductase [Nocardia araoensis]
MMRISLAYTGFGSILANLPAIHAADECGLDGIWYAEHICNHDAIVPATVYLRETERLELALMGVSTAGRHPGVAAMELASLAEIAPGRVRAAVGTGVPEMIAKLGKRPRRPVQETIALHQALRTALAGGDLNADYGDFGFTQFKMNPLAGPPPLDIMAIRPRMVEAAARHADGVCLSAGSSRKYLAQTVQRVETTLAESGRDRASFRITSLVAAFITDDMSKARSQVAALLSTFDPATTEYLAAGAIPDGALVRAVGEGGPFAAMPVFTPDVIDAVAMVCPPDGIGEALGRYAETGIDELAVALFAPTEQIPELVRAMAASRPTLGSSLS